MSGLLSPVTAVYQSIPPDLAAPSLVGNLFTIWAGGFGIAVIPWALWRLLAKKDDVPIWMIVGGFICSLLEPMLDTLGHLWWPANLPGPAFVGYDLHVPWLIPPCYVFFISMTGYFAYTRMKAGLDLKGLFTVWVLIALTDLVMETPGTSMGAYVYYGDASFKILGFPLAWCWMNGTSMLMTGVVLYLVEPILKGWNRAFLGLVTVGAMGAAYGVMSWPYFISLNFNGLPWIVSRGLTLVSLLLCIMLVRLAGLVVTRKQPASAASHETAAAALA